MQENIARMTFAAAGAGITSIVTHDFDAGITMSNQNITGANSYQLADASAATEITEGYLFSTNTQGNVNLSAVDATEYIKFGGNDAADFELRLINHGAGEFNLNVLGDIATTGTVDGVDIAARDHAVYTNTEAIDAVEAVSTGTSVAADWMIFSNAGVLERQVLSGLTHGILTGLGGRYADSEAVDAIEAVGTATPISTDTAVFSDAGVLQRIAFSGLTHSILTGLGGRYADSEAVDAVEAVGSGTPISTDNIIFKNATVLEQTTFASLTNAIMTGLTIGDMSDVVDDTTPQLGGDLDLNDFAIDLNHTGLDDHEATGFMMTFTSSGTINLGELVYLNATDNTIALADADNTTTMPAIGIAMETTTNNPTKVLMWGVFRDDSWSFAQGSVNGIVYASVTTGDFTITAPSGSGDQVQPLGNVIEISGETYIIFNPSNTVVQVV